MNSVVKELSNVSVINTNQLGMALGKEKSTSCRKCKKNESTKHLNVPLFGQ